MTMKLLIQYFVKCPSVWACWCFLIIRMNLGIWGQEYQRNDDVSFSAHHIKEILMSTCLFIRDVNFDHLAKVCLPNFSTINLQSFPLHEKITGGGEDTLRLCQYPILLKLWSNFSIHWWVLSTRFYYCSICLIMTFIFPLFFILMKCSCFKNKNKTVLSPNLFLYSIIHISISSWIFILSYGLKSN